MDGYYYGSSSIDYALTNQYSVPPSSDLTNLSYAPIPALISNDDQKLLEELASYGPVRSYRLYCLWYVLTRFSHSRDHDWIPWTLIRILEGNDNDLNVWLWVDGDEKWMEEVMPQLCQSSVFLCWSWFDSWMKDQFRHDATSALRRRLQFTSSSSPHDQHAGGELSERQCLVQDVPDCVLRLAAICWMLCISNSVASREVEYGVRPTRTFKLADWHIYHPWFRSDPPHETFDQFYKQMDLWGHTCHHGMEDYLPRWYNVITLLSKKSQVGVLCLDRTDCPARDQPPSPLVNFPDDFKHQRAITSDKMLIDHQGLMHPDIIYGALLVNFDLWHKESFQYIAQRLAEIFTVQTWASCNEDLKKHLTIEPPDLRYLPWINSYPRAWRCSISESLHYSVGQIRESIGHLVSISTSTTSQTTQSRTLLGAVNWVAIEAFGCRRNVDILHDWFDSIEEIVDCFPGLPAIETTSAMASLYRQVKESRATCSKSHNAPIFDLYVSVMALLNKSEVPESLKECADHWGWKCVQCHVSTNWCSEDSSPTSSRGSSHDQQPVNAPPSLQPIAENPPSVVILSHDSVDSAFHAPEIRHESSLGGLFLLEWADSIIYQPTCSGGRENGAPQASAVAADEVDSILPIPPLRSSEQEDHDHLTDLYEHPTFAALPDLGLAVDGTSATTQLPVSSNPVQPESVNAVGTISALLRDPRLSFADRQALLNDVQRELIDVASSSNFFLSVPTADRLIIEHGRLSSETVPAGSSSEPMNEDPPLVGNDRAARNVPENKIIQGNMMLTMNGVAAAPSPRTGETTKAKKVNAIKLYLRTRLEEIGANPPGTGVPWSTLPQLVKKCGYKFVNWPKDVPVPIPSENKGIMGLRAKQINSLYRAVTRQDEARRLTFRPIGSGDPGEPSMQEEAERIGAGGEMLMMRVLTQENFIDSFR
ncbi:hypothetical protein JAAARDRAFT_212130 [Jaapia argillacea MUCL 33604]|uniref:Uncharacterized protein n=1 Tax=Jaapia argillacea MUCL 33604 TaxID=933084 RepID=A0A067PGI3_9AGAM|nr:hypothetical protein JAAARDRAFT_212130 [Jaapia argillacea MUCL 33604]